MLPTRPAREQGTVEVQLSAGFAVSQWRVTMGAEDVEPESSDQGTWRGVIAKPGSVASFEFFVEAQSENHFANHRHALQVSLRDGDRRAERTVWGDGDVSVLVNVDEWLATRD